MGKPSLSGENLSIHYTIKSLIVKRYPPPTENIQIQLYVRCPSWVANKSVTLSHRLRQTRHGGGVRGGFHRDSNRTGWHVDLRHRRVRYVRVGQLHRPADACLRAAASFSNIFPRNSTLKKLCQHFFHQITTPPRSSRDEPKYQFFNPPCSLALLIVPLFSSSR